MMSTYIGPPQGNVLVRSKGDSSVKVPVCNGCLPVGTYRQVIDVHFDIFHGHVTRLIVILENYEKLSVEVSKS